MSFVDVNLIVELHATPHSKYFTPTNSVPCNLCLPYQVAFKPPQKDPFYSGSNLQCESVTPPFLMSLGTGTVRLQTQVDIITCSLITLLRGRRISRVYSPLDRRGLARTSRIFIFLTLRKAVFLYCHVRSKPLNLSSRCAVISQQSVQS